MMFIILYKGFTYCISLGMYLIREDPNILYTSITNQCVNLYPRYPYGNLCTRYQILMAERLARFASILPESHLGVHMHIILMHLSIF